MLNATQETLNKIVSPVRKLHAKVELYEGSTLVETCYCNDRLRYFNIERIGDTSKFFGFGICQRLNVHLIDKYRELDLTTANHIRISYTVDDSNFIYPYPDFYISEVRRDENTNELSITAYDRLYKNSSYKFSDIMHIPEEWCMDDYAYAVANLLDVPRLYEGLSDLDPCLRQATTVLPNYYGDESIREVLDDIAETTQTIYFIKNINGIEYLVFKRMDRDGEPVLTIRKDDYITLDSKTNRKLTAICRTTELADDITASTGQVGTTQYIRENGFWTLREDLDYLMNWAIESVGNFLINQFNCTWRGNFLLEIGDKISLVNKAGETVYSYIIDDVITYTGFLSETTMWEYTENEAETAHNPSTLGDALHKTFAQVDKVNGRIDLVVSQTEKLEERTTQLSLQDGEILSQVVVINESVDAITGEVSVLTNKVSQSVSQENVEFIIQQQIESGIVDSITTSTGYSFDKDGLTISKENNELSTIITENGMVINSYDSPILQVNNQGIEAEDLHATTYLLIGENSRFEDFGGNRTGCFWIGNIAEAVLNNE